MVALVPLLVAKSPIPILAGPVRKFPGQGATAPGNPGFGTRGASIVLRGIGPASAHPGFR